MIAAGADIVLPTAGGIACGFVVGAIKVNPITGAIGSVGGVVAGDKVASYIKDNYLMTDEEKNRLKN